MEPNSERFELELNGREWDTSGSSFVQILSVLLEIRFRPKRKNPERVSRLCERATACVFSEPAQIPVLAKLLSSQPDVDDEMGFRKHLRRIVSFLSDLDDASDFLRAAVCFIRSTSSTRADRHNPLAARSATGGSTATAARASKCILALIRPACYPAQNSIRTNRFRGRTALIRTHARCGA